VKKEITNQRNTKEGNILLSKRSRHKDMPVYVLRRHSYNQRRLQKKIYLKELSQFMIGLEELLIIEIVRNKWSED
jgi:hypothetical protein